jgi:hypothetical protein
MARRREYGWNPKVMARINARNISAGRKQYIDSRMNDDENYRAKYDEEVARLAGGQKAKATPAFPSERPSALDQYKGQKSLTDRMAERPSALGNRPSSMESRRAIADEDFRKKFGKGQKGISTPMTKSAMERVMGTA